MSDTILALSKATKLYAGVPAIEGVDFELRRGEIHALVGENGAGKSTLTKVMAGVVTLTSGTMQINGVEIAPKTPLEARHLGIAMVFQENSLVPTMTVAQNLFLGQERFYNRLRGIYIAAQQFLQSLNFDVTPTATVGLLGAAKKQMVEIARAVLHEAKVIIFDEPTATLTPEEKKYFFDLVRDLKRRGVSIVFISHALEEALVLADRITILRDGKHVLTDDAAKFDRARIVQAMVGRDLSNTLYGSRKTTMRPAGARVLTVQNLKMAPMVRNNSLSVFAGQITGVFGLVGAGRTETFKIVAGVLKRDFFHGGEVILHDKPVRYRVPAPAVRAGIAYVTEDRKVEGFFETMSVARNIYLGLLAKLPGGRFFLSRREADKIGTTWVEKLKVRTTGNDMKVVELSGGNQQKVVIAKSLVQDPDLIIFDEPTRGVDVGAIVEIHELDPAARRRRQGCGGDLVIPTRNHGAVGPHPGLAPGQGGRGIFRVRSHGRENHVRSGSLKNSAPAATFREAAKHQSGSRIDRPASRQKRTSDPPFSARTEWPADAGPLAMTYDSFDEISATFLGFKDVPWPNGGRVRNWRQVGKQLRMILHHLQNVLRLDVRVDIESGFQHSKLGQPFFGAAKRAIVVGGNRRSACWMLNCIAASATSSFSPGIQRVRDLGGLLRILAHPLVGLGNGGEEFLDGLRRSSPPRAGAPR